MTGKRTKPACSVIIRAYNEEAHLGRLLEGIFQQTVQDVEVILVDSGSTDGTLKVASAYPVNILQIPPLEFSFGRSLNLGISHTRSEIVVIASAHVYPVYPDWLERLLAPFSDPQVALVYGKQRGDEQAKFSEQQIFLRWYPDQTQLHQAHPFCNNANAALRRSLWQANPFDETLSGLEDLAWARWAVDQGHRLAYIAEAAVIHVHRETPRGVYNRYYREAMAFKRLFPYEHFRFTEFLYLVTSTILSDIWHASRQGVFRRHLTGIVRFRWMQFWGTYQGYRQSGPLTGTLRQTFYYPQGINKKNGDTWREVEPIRYNSHNG